MTAESAHNSVVTEDTLHEKTGVERGISGDLVDGFEVYRREAEEERGLGGARGADDALRAFVGAKEEHGAGRRAQRGDAGAGPAPGGRREHRCARGRLHMATARGDRPIARPPHRLC